MKAIVCTALTGLDGLELQDVPTPEPGPGQVRVRVHAAGINFADTLIIKGRYQVRPEPPFTPGLEAAGEVVACGPGVSWQVGARVAVLCDYGAFAEEVVVAAERLVPLPDAMDYVTAAGFLVAWGTSHIALRHRGGLKAGETLLVHGAAGGVGLTAVAIGKRLGATVIATAGDDEKLALVREHGADHTINYRTGGFRDTVRELTGGRGADVIYDPVGGDVFDESLRCINWEGRLLVIGFASGRVPEAPANLLLVKNCSAIGVYWGAYAMKDPKVLVDSLAELFRWYAEGSIRPHTSMTFPLEQATDALRALKERRSTGKVVLTVR